MIKRILQLTLLFTFSQLAFAVQCPSPSDWSHVKGQEWQLSDAAKAQGWEPVSMSEAIDSDLTQLPPDIHLLIGVSTTGYKFTTCGYSLKPGDENNVIAAVNMQDPVDIKKLQQPPFICRPARCFCETTAGHPETCVWQWISKIINPAG